MSIYALDAKDMVQSALTGLAAFSGYPTMCSHEAELLILGTMAKESNFGYYWRQIEGPAISPFQLEMPTILDITNRYFSKRPVFRMAVEETCCISFNGLIPAHMGDIIKSNFRFACILARFKYWMAPSPIPKQEWYGAWTPYMRALGEYWDVHYNINPHVGTPEEFMKTFEDYVLPLYEGDFN